MTQTFRFRDDNTVPYSNSSASAFIAGGGRLGAPTIMRVPMDTVGTSTTLRLSSLNSGTNVILGGGKGGSVPGTVATGSSVTIDLPPPMVGLNYTFTIAAKEIPTNVEVLIRSRNADDQHHDLITGSITSKNPAVGAVDRVITTYAALNKNARWKGLSANAVIGDYLRLISDGYLWYATGVTAESAVVGTSGLYLD